MSDLFVSPHNYCDTHCERCPLRGSCEVARTDARRRQAHIERGVDPDDPEVVLEDVLADVRYAIERVQSSAAAESVDLAPLDDVRGEPRVISLAVERLERLGTRVAVQARRLARTLDDDALAPGADELRRELLFQSFLVARKCGRLATHLDTDGRPFTEAESWIADGAPNVLLLEEAQRRLRCAMDALFDEATRAPLARLHREIDRQLVPLQAAVPDEARLALAAMIARGTAPSPFCIE